MSAVARSKNTQPGPRTAAALARRPRVSDDATNAGRRRRCEDGHWRARREPRRADRPRPGSANARCSRPRCDGTRSARESREPGCQDIGCPSRPGFRAHRETRFLNSVAEYPPQDVGQDRSAVRVGVRAVAPDVIDLVARSRCGTAAAIGIVGGAVRVLERRQHLQVREMPVAEVVVQVVRAVLQKDLDRLDPVAPSAESASDRDRRPAPSARRSAPAGSRSTCSCQSC